MASKSTTKAAPSVAIFIGCDSAFSDAVASNFDVTLTASRSPFLGKKEGTPDEWRAHCVSVFEESDTAEAPVIAEAMRLVMGHYSVTVFCDSLSFGVRSATKVEKYPTIASPEAWRNVGGAARALGARVIFI